MVRATVDELSTTAEELMSSLGFGDGERGGAGEVVGETGGVVGEVGAVVGATLAHAYSTVKSRRATADPSSAALSHAQL